ncbi:hypothetical protein M0208_01445 [Sphingomonas sp. SUN019]|uniref:hypothetical protein n=1 Tax=Sphingomonas sp. SUN019 TaxID=2937788 RepID=UPI002164DCCF|nr:hypothetical protein [Sphingomonas sp. SUN019]UVO49245.1 hypothetical protein M0208_01445 [Sphingomonas sp. SUN019]
MTDGNKNPDYSVTPEMLDQLQEQRVAAVVRQKQEAETREEWPLHVNATLRALGEKVQEYENRIATLEAGRG